MSVCSGGKRWAEAARAHRRGRRRPPREFKSCHPEGRFLPRWTYANGCGLHRSFASLRMTKQNGRSRQRGGCRQSPRWLSSRGLSRCGRTASGFFCLGATITVLLFENLAQSLKELFRRHLCHVTRLQDGIVPNCWTRRSSRLNFDMVAPSTPSDAVETTESFGILISYGEFSTMTISTGSSLSSGRTRTLLTDPISTPAARTAAP